MNSKT
jgi:uncharacterized membrane protein